MKRNRHFASRQLLLMGALFALIAGELVEPWQVLAQEADAPGVDVAADKKPAEHPWGDLKGRFIYDGEPPAPVPVQLNKRNDPQVYGHLNIVDESLVVAKDRSLANVVVWVRNKNVPIHNNYDALKKLETDIQIFNGRFEPHITPYWTGQPLKVRNLDPVPNNVSGPLMTNNSFNVLLRARASAETPALANSEPVPVKLSCNIHAWLKGWLVVQPHPYVAVSDADGRFELKNLPAGMPLEFQVWQETAGYVQKAQVAGQDAGWTKGRFTLTLKHDENHDLGDIKLDPQQFEKGAVFARAAAAPAQQLTDPLNGALQRAAAATPAVAVLGKGDKFKLEAGKLTVKIPNVGQMLLEGPATVALVDEQRLKLSQGRVKLRITEAASRGFVVETPHGQVAELGTETTVSVDEAGKADVVIRDGNVEVVAPRKAEGQPANKKADPSPASDAQEPMPPNQANGEAAAPPASGRQPARETTTDRGGFGGRSRSSNGSGEFSRGGFVRGPSEEQVQEQAKLEKLLIGTWRGGHSDGEVVFREGGIFEEIPQTMSRFSVRLNDSKHIQGKWEMRIAPSQRPSIISLTREGRGASLRGLPIVTGAGQGAEGTQVVVLRLDEKFLRLRADNQVLFFVRAKDRQLPHKPDDAVPINIRHLVELAELAGDDAAALAAPKTDWLKQWDVTDPQFRLIQRVAKARRGEIDLAELFDLSKEEADAYAKLYSMTDGNFKAIRELADKGQLSSAEVTALKKLSAAKDEFERGLGAMKDGIAKIVRADLQSAPTIQPKTVEALEKLSAGLDHLWSFPSATVFADPTEQPGMRGGGGF